MESQTHRIRVYHSRAPPRTRRVHCSINRAARILQRPGEDADKGVTRWLGPIESVLFWPLGEKEKQMGTASSQTGRNDVPGPKRSDTQALPRSGILQVRRAETDSDLAERNRMLADYRLR